MRYDRTVDELIKSTRRLVALLFFSIFITAAASFSAGYFYCVYEDSKATITITPVSAEDIEALGLETKSELEIIQERKGKK